MWAQDVGGGRPVAVEGDVPLWGMQIDVAAAAEEVRAVGRDDGAKPLDDFLGSVGLGAIGEQLKDLRLSAALPRAAALCGRLLSLFLKKPRYILVFCLVRCFETICKHHVYS